MADEPPELWIAASNDLPTIKKDEEWARNRYEWAIRDFFANALRVMRGAGKPFDLLRDLDALIKATRELDPMTLYDATLIFQDTLQSAFKQDIDLEGVPAARQTIARGALQMLASELVGQSTQKRRGESEIHDGIREMQDAWAEGRKRRESEEAKASMERMMRVFRRPIPGPKPQPRAGRKPAAKRKVTKAREAPAEATAQADSQKPSSTAEFMKSRQRKLHGDKDN